MPLPLALPRYVCAGLILFVYSAAISQTTPTLQVEARRNHKEAWKSYPTRTTDQLAGFVSKSVPPRLDQYGGLADDKSSATGFFRTEKRGGRWWLIDPEGGKFLHVGVASVRSGNTSASQTSWTEKFGSAEKWAEATNALLRAHGFNGTGAWSDTKFLQTAPQKVAYTLNWNFMSSYGAARGGTYQLPGHTGYPGNCIFVFDPEFETFCGQHAKKLTDTKNDPWLLGHFF